MGLAMALSALAMIVFYSPENDKLQSLPISNPTEQAKHIFLDFD